MKNKKGFFKKGFLVYIFISLIVLLVLFFTTSNLSQLKILLHLKWRYFLLLIAVIFVRMTFDALGLKALVPGSVAISLWQTAKIRLMGIYFAVAVPITTSQVYFQSYLLSRFGISYAESLGILTLRTLLPTLFFLLLIPIYILVPLPFSGSLFLQKIIQITIISLIGVILLIVGFLFFPDPLLNAIKKLLRLFVKIKFLKKERYNGWAKKSEESIFKVSRLFQLYFREQPGILLRSLLYVIISFLFEFLTANLVILGMGLAVPFWKLYFLQFFLKIIVQYAPSPGGSGIDELTYAALFALFIPKGSIALTVFIWRFFHAYLLILIGGVITFLEFRGRKMPGIVPKNGDATSDALNTP